MSREPTGFDRADRLEQLNGLLGGFARGLGLRYVVAEPEEIAAELEIDARHLQPYGLVHGGVYASMIESVCSAGTALHVMSQGQSAVGLENTTSFLKAVREGVLRCTARPLVRGRRTHVWNAEIHDDRGRLVATGRVRMMVLEGRDRVAGEAIRLQEGG